MFLTPDRFSSFFQNLAPSNTQFANAFQNLVPANDAFAGTVKANLEKQVAFFTTLSETVVDSVSKIAELNINACKTSLEETKVVSNQLFAAKAPQDTLQLVTALQQPTITKLTAYNRHLADIASGAQAAISTAIQEQVKESTRQLTQIVDAAAKHAPAGSENVVTMAKSVIANANAGFDHLNKATQQAVEVAQANVTASVNQAAQIVDQAGAAVTRTRK